MITSLRVGIGGKSSFPLLSSPRDAKEELGGRGRGYSWSRVASAAGTKPVRLLRQGNYILERDELLEAQKPEYDVILCLSVTKWVQLNWGDEGLKLLFKRAYRHLRPGGLFVLEPQAWSSYKKRKNLTETISRHYHRIKLKPEQFPSYLISSEVGFASYELVAMPRNTPKGFQRPIYLFRKGHPGTTH